MVLAIGLGYWLWNKSLTSAPSASATAFVGSDTCSGCHQAEAALWRASQHKQAMDHATDKTVLGDLLCCLPQVEMPCDLGYDKIFRVVIVQFLDRFNFCIAAVKRSCIHFVTPERKIIPFDTYNLFYRNGLVDRFRGHNPLPQSEHV